jgi:hypothetical protein
MFGGYFNDVNSYLRGHNSELFRFQLSTKSRICWLSMFGRPDCLSSTICLWTFVLEIVFGFLYISFSLAFKLRSSIGLMTNLCTTVLLVLVSSQSWDSWCILVESLVFLKQLHAVYRLLVLLVWHYCQCIRSSWSFWISSLWNCSCMSAPCMNNECFFFNDASANICLFYCQMASSIGHNLLLLAALVLLNLSSLCNRCSHINFPV